LVICFAEHGNVGYYLLKMNSTTPRWFFRTLLVIIALGMLVRLFYWGYTERTWEDALITVLHSENAASGLGLTHITPGEPPLHGFTSPLSVLLPLIGDLYHVGYGLPFLKFLSVLFGGIAVWLGARISLNLGLPPALALTAAAFLAFEHHQILWGMAGMETQVVTVAYLWSIYCMQRGTQWQKGLSLGFTMLASTRCRYLGRDRMFDRVMASLSNRCVARPYPGGLRTSLDLFTMDNLHVPLLRQSGPQ
jgi:hypothetical protein